MPAPFRYISRWSTPQALSFYALILAVPACNADDKSAPEPRSAAATSPPDAGKDSGSSKQGAGGNSSVNDEQNTGGDSEPSGDMGSAGDSSMKDELAMITTGVITDGVIGEYCTRFRDKLQQCELGGLWERSQWDCVEIILTRTDKCELDCLNDLSCSELVRDTCQEEQSCFLECQADSDFVCEIGINWRRVCDGIPDCQDGTDEHDECPGTRFLCADGVEDITRFSVCNGIEDCADGSDEHSDCPPLDFTCANGTVIRGRFECNGSEDCSDGSDEHSDCPADFVCTHYIPDNKECDGIEHCYQGEDEHDECWQFEYFQCSEQQIISPYYECDGQRDCINGADEHALCPGSESFLCDNGIEIRQRDVCNRINDCVDGSDEKDDCWYKQLCD